MISLRSKLGRKTIDIAGQKTVVYGKKGDRYFDNLAAFAGQNSVLDEELDKLPAHATIIDVGANIGVTTVAAARKLPEGKVIAIEPSPLAFECLEKTIYKNNLSNVTLLNIGAGESPGEIGFVESEFLAGSYVALDAREPNSTKIKVKTLDMIVEQQNIAGVDLIKIDVEGFELDVLQGAQNTIERFNPRFVLEFNSFALTANRNISPRSLLDFVLDNFDEFQVLRDGVKSTISSPTDTRDFIYSNMAVQGCVDDISFGGRKNI